MMCGTPDRERHAADRHREPEDRVNLADKDTFSDHVSHCGQPLVRTAYLLTDSWPDAESLVERALTQTYLQWPSVRDVDPTGHTLSGVVKAYLHRPQRAGVALDGPTSPTWTAVKALLPEERVAVVLRIFNRVSTPKIAELLETSEHEAEDIMISAAERLRTSLAGQPLAGRPLEAVLADEMDDRVAYESLAPARFASVARRAGQARLRRLVPAAVALALAVPLVVWALSALTGGGDGDADVAATATRSIAPATTSATASRSATTKTALPTATSSPGASKPPAPKGRLTVPVLVGRRIVDLADGTARTAATLKSADGVTVLRAGERFVVRAGAVRKPAALLLVAADGDITEIAKSTGSVAIDEAGRRVAYTEVDADGTATRLVVAELIGGREPVTNEPRFGSLVVRGFVGDAVLLSYLEGGEEIARRWNPVANDFTILRRRYGAVHAVHPAEKLAAMQQRETDCAVVATIINGVVSIRGRDCARDLSNSAFSPDGKQIAVVEDDVVTVLDVGEGLPSVARLQPGEDVRDVAWDSNGALAVVSGAGADAKVQRCDVGSGKCTSIWTPGTAGVRLVS
jgi:hypothetical protein